MLDDIRNHTDDGKRDHSRRSQEGGRNETRHRIRFERQQNIVENLPSKIDRKGIERVQHNASLQGGQRETLPVTQDRYRPPFDEGGTARGKKEVELTFKNRSVGLSLNFPPSATLSRTSFVNSTCSTFSGSDFELPRWSLSRILWILDGSVEP